MNEFISNPEMESILSRVDSLKSKKTRYSDIEDADGNQYVDLVQEGGGVLGIALVGYTYVLEKARIRFFSLAGTSAGAINTMLLTSVGKMSEAKSEKILELLAKQSLFDFVDGPPAVKKLITNLLSKPVFMKIIWTILFNFGSLKTALLKKYGLNPAVVFEKWIKEILNDVGIRDLATLDKQRNVLPDGLINVNQGGNTERLQPKLAIVTADVTTHTKVEFPRMAPLYWAESEKINPARLVKASMSIPLFFEPLKIADIPDAGKKHHSSWIEMADYYGEIPSEALFVDGGLLSNFPINIFHRSDGGVPRMPTFGVRLSAYRDGYGPNENIGQLLGSIITTMRHDNDIEFLIKNPDYHHLICQLDVDKDFNWLDFNMSKEKQVQLFIAGAQKAIDFLENFNWPEYKELRANLGKIKKQVQETREKSQQKPEIIT